MDIGQYSNGTENLSYFQRLDHYRKLQSCFARFCQMSHALHTKVWVNLQSSYTVVGYSRSSIFEAILGFFLKPFGLQVVLMHGKYTYLVSDQNSSQILRPTQIQKHLVTIWSHLVRTFSLSHMTINFNATIHLKGVLELEFHHLITPRQLAKENNHAANRHCQHSYSNR